MKLTKYQHACFMVEKDGQALVVDPGTFSSDFIAPSNVVAVVVTHEHPDHFDLAHLNEIADKNPDVQIFAPEPVVSKLEAFNKQAAVPGEKITVGPFELVFHGGQHALIHDSIPPIKNIGLMINDLIYFPGDSFTLPGTPVDTLLLPASAPWMKAGDAMNFLGIVKPRLCIPTHDAILSSEGKEVIDRLLSGTASANGAEYLRPEAPIAI